MYAAIFCAAIAGHYHPSVVERGCDLAKDAELASVEHKVDFYTLMALAWRESKWTRETRSTGGYCGAWQIHPKWSKVECTVLQRRFSGANAAAAFLAKWRSFSSKRRFACKSLQHPLTKDAPMIQGYTGYYKSKVCPVAVIRVLDRAEWFMSMSNRGANARFPSIQGIPTFSKESGLKAP